MADLFNKIVKQHFEPLGFKVSKLNSTRHWNVLRLYDPSDKKYYVAKGILHIDGNNDLGPKQMNKAYNNESSILLKLPDWWGLYLKESFKEDPFRIIVTPEIPNCKWITYNGDDKIIADKIFKQLEWLHKNKIAHNDLELKNILLTCDNKNAIIIDFEKATRGASNSSMRDDYRKIVDSLKENKKTTGIATQLEKIAFGKFPLTRRMSIGGTKSICKYKTRKNHK